jgi:hypothetical protein
MIIYLLFIYLFIDTALIPYVLQSKMRDENIIRMPSSGMGRRVGRSGHTRSTRCHIPEDGILHSHHRENFKSYKILYIY